VLKWESVREQQQLEEQTLEMRAFVDRLLGVGVLVKQRRRWGRSRVSRLQLGADKTLSWVAAARRCGGKTIPMSQIVAVYRDNCNLTLIAPKHGQVLFSSLAVKSTLLIRMCAEAYV
jgi:hypothetical protein